MLKPQNVRDEMFSSVECPARASVTWPFCSGLHEDTHCAGEFVKALPNDRFANEIVIGFDLSKHLRIVEVKSGYFHQNASRIALRFKNTSTDDCFAELAQQVALLERSALHVVSVNHGDRHGLLHLQLAVFVSL